MVWFEILLVVSPKERCSSVLDLSGIELVFFVVAYIALFWIHAESSVANT